MRKIDGFMLFVLGVILGGLIIKLGPISIPNNINIASGENLYKNTENKNLKYYKNKYERFELIDDILNEGYYDYEHIDQSNMVENALKSYVNGIDDPYTVYMDAVQNSGFMQDLEGEDEFEGIGAVVTKKDYYIQIEEVLKESPAFKAGILPLDRIIKIDSGYVEDETLDQSVSRMRGPSGTTVNVIVERFTKILPVLGDESSNLDENSDLSIENERELLEIEIERGKINVPSVVSQVLEIGDKKIGYIEMFIIGEETEKLFKREILDLKKQGVGGIILDLRGNGGGLMPIAVEITSHFIEKGKTIVIAKYKGYEDEIYYSKGFGDFEGQKIVVLIDGMTASAGEIIAMALQEQVGAKLLGTTTFGKGTIQTLADFENGDSLKYTIGKWFAPSEKNIDKVGVDPDIIVEFDMENYLENDIDNQLEEAKSVFK